MATACQHLFPIKSVHLVLPPPLAYGLYTCENVHNYGWSLTQMINDLGWINLADKRKCSNLIPFYNIVNQYVNAPSVQFRI